MPAPGACLALTVWTQVVVAFILPTAVLLSLHRRPKVRSAPIPPPIVPPRPAASLVAAAAAALEPPAGRLRPPDPALLQWQDDEWSIPAVSCFAAQMVWLLLRSMLHDASA